LHRLRHQEARRDEPDGIAGGQPGDLGGRKPLDLPAHRHQHALQRQAEQEKGDAGEERRDAHRPKGPRKASSAATRSFGLSPCTVWPAWGMVTRFAFRKCPARRSASSSWNTSLSPPRTTRVGQATLGTTSQSAARSARRASSLEAEKRRWSYFHTQLPAAFW